MSDITPCTATVPTRPDGDSASSRQGSSDVFGTQLQDALHAGQPGQAATTTQATTTQVAAAQVATTQLATTETVGATTGSMQTASSLLINHSGSNSVSSSTQREQAKPDPMKAAERSSASNPPVPAQADVVASDVAVPGPVSADMTADAASPAATAQPVPIADASGPAAVANVPARPAMTEPGPAAGKARKASATPDGKNDDAGTGAKGSSESGVVLPATMPATQPAAPQRTAPLPANQADTAVTTRPSAGGGRTAHAAGATIVANADATGAATVGSKPTPLTATNQAGPAPVADPLQGAAFEPVPSLASTMSAMSMQTTSAASTMTAVPSTSSPSGSDPASGAAGLTAAAQLSGPMVTLAHKMDGASSMAVSLHPKELGAVTITLDRDAGGAVRVVVAATEPATLRSLIADQSHLHAALDAAAVPAADRHVSFELAGSGSGSGGDGAGSQSAQANAGNDGQRGGGQTQRQGWEPVDPGDPDAEALPAFASFPIPTRFGRYRSGVNITA